MIEGVVNGVMKGVVDVARSQGGGKNSKMSSPLATHIPFPSTVPGGAANFLAEDQDGGRHFLQPKLMLRLHMQKNQRNKKAKKAMINTSEIAPIDCSIESASFDSAPIDIPSEIAPIDCSIEISLFDSASIGIPFVAEVAPIGCSFEIDSRPAASQSSSLVTSTMAVNFPDDDEVCA